MVHGCMSSASRLVDVDVDPCVDYIINGFVCQTQSETAKQTWTTMQPLSEKAKGKQRAVPIPEDVFDSAAPPPPRELMVRFTDGVEDLVLHIAEHDSVRDVKAKVCLPLPLDPLAIAYPSTVLSLSLTTKMIHCRTASDSRRAPSTATPPLAPHPRGAAPTRQDAAGILVRHARRASAACCDDDKGQGRGRPINIAHRSTSTMVTLLGRRATYRW